MPTGPRIARPGDKLRKRFEGWPQAPSVAAILRDAARSRIRYIPKQHTGRASIRACELPEPGLYFGKSVVAKNAGGGILDLDQAEPREIGE